MGLLGSKYYLSRLNKEEKSKIKMYLNFDTIGSVNYIRYVYNGNSIENNSLKNSSTKIQLKFEEYFKLKNLTWSLSPLINEGSDHGPFILENIPSGGLFSGSERKKTLSQKNIFGGLENEPCDNCYHRLCDGILNINYFSILELSKSAAYTIHFFVLNYGLKFLYE
jgi:Zn-dependent M28 family amino/carboxypeptidase